MKGGSNDARPASRTPVKAVAAVTDDSRGSVFPLAERETAGPNLVGAGNHRSDGSGDDDRHQVVADTPVVVPPIKDEPRRPVRRLRVRSHKAKRRKKKRGRPTSANRVRIVPEHHVEPDARKLSRAFLALALHQAAREVDAEQEHHAQFDSGDGDEPS